MSALRSLFSDVEDRIKGGGGRLVFAEEKGKHEGERDVDFRVVLERECLKTSFKYEERCYWMFVTYFR